MSTATIHAAEYPIEKVLSDDYVFTIPKYQRPYSWTTEQAELLYDDLLLTLQQSTGSVDTLNPYFLGSIVLIKGDNPEAEVVDGQQRLTTLTILLAVLREMVPSDVATNFTAFLYEKGNMLKGTQDRYRLTLRERDADFFRTNIQNEKGINNLKGLQTSVTSSQRNIRENALLFAAKIEELGESERIRLAMFIIKRCFLVVVRTPDFDSAYRIFSVLNDRGLDLTHSDILKAEVIGNIPAAKQDTYTEKWEEAEDELGREEFKELFGHIRMIFRKRKLEKSVLEEVRKYVNPTKDPERFMDKVLIPMANAMKDITSLGYESSTFAEEINRMFKLLQRVDNSDWMPPAILYMSMYHNNPAELLKFLSKLERLAMGLLILRANVNERLERYGQLLELIESNLTGLYSSNSPLDLTDNEKKDIIATLDGPFYPITKIRLPVMLRLDEELSGGNASYNYKVLSVEHVLPQNPKLNSQWMSWYPDQTLREATVHRIGNLALLSRAKNSQAGNLDFDRKKQEYFVKKGISPFAITTQVLQEKEWSYDILQKRQKSLLDKLIHVWDLQ
ncbi:DUF262 domain-containing protein [Paenibacillus soyae]|uniref:DUF262 domain-containing HNH endonuclease family protein n=1 Tax=Paenibacillus soyae TaxID=2969249 RepID=A0A9X2SDC0_9BACL|nr:DUF262 domain-containing HNH endonuclease family protein [Paenibacillus soyae]MCR2807728.1 DUF262 domain-containing HNH endonuclease family protein [Paenibacillus soyae]